MKSQTTFEIFQFENRPPPVGAKTKMDFHVSLGFLASIQQARVERKGDIFGTNFGHSKFDRELLKLAETEAASVIKLVDFQP